MRTNADIIGTALIRGNVSTVTTGLFTDSIMSKFFNEAHRWACGYSKWPFTEGRYSTTWAGTEEVNYPEGWRSDSIRFLEIGSKELEKVNFYDYKRWREDYSSNEDRVFSDHFRILFVNPNVDTSGTLTVYGQYVPASQDLTEAAQVTQFSDREDDGNEAICERILKLMKEREKKFSEAREHDQNSREILERLKQSVGSEQSGYKPYDSGMFKRVSVVDGSLHDDMPTEKRF